MSDAFQTPFPTASSRSQAFALKTTRPVAEGQLSPVPQVEGSKPVVKRVYARRKALTSASSRNLKENSKRHSGSGSEEGLLNLRAKLRARRTTSLASLKDRQKEHSLRKGRHSAERLAKSYSQVSLASPFSSQPSSPAKAPANTSKRALLDNSNVPVSKRRQSAVPIPGRLPDPIPFRSSRSERGRIGAEGQIQRRPSHPTLGLETLGCHDEDINFDLQSSLASVNFNRPPSQLSIYATAECDDGEYLQNGMVKAETLVYNDRFGMDIGLASTPNNHRRALEGRPLSLGFMPMGPPSSPKCKVSPSASITRRGSVDGVTQNMSLTSVKEGSVHDADPLGDHTRWITDSLISPPTVYVLQRQGDKKNPDSLVKDQLEAVNPVGSTAGQELITSSEPNDDGDCTEPRRQAPGRTRSGTILAPAPIISGRTRTGTVTDAPALAKKQSRTRSGTITPSSAQAPSLGTVLTIPCRTRSGTIVARPRSRSRKSVSSLGPTRDSHPARVDLDLEGQKAQVDVDPLVDAQYDPTPDLPLAFSPAPNPDLELEAESDDDGNLGSRLGLSPNAGSKMSRKVLLLLSPQIGPSNVETAAGTTIKPGNKRSKRQSLKMALGLKGSGERRDGRAPSVPDREITGSPLNLMENRTSSDPIDFLSQFDEQAFNKPYEEPKQKNAARGKRTAVR